MYCSLAMSVIIPFDQNCRMQRMPKTALNVCVLHIFQFPVIKVDRMAWNGL